MTRNNSHTTREGWLLDAVARLDLKFFSENGYDLPEKMAVSCGFPRGVARAIGQCWDPKVCDDGTVQIFICPSIAEPTRVLDILLHEMIHAAVGIEAGHRGPFRKLAKEFGLSGKMTATVAEEGSELHRTLSSMADAIGPYPHAAMQKKAPKRGTNTWIRLRSIEDDTFKVVISPKIMEEHGAPRDPWGHEMVPINQ